MEEQILKIIKDNECGFDDGYGGTIDAVADDSYFDVAKEITSHIMEFIEWIKTDCCFNDYGDLIINDNRLPDVILTTEQLYEYWLKNIKK